MISDGSHIIKEEGVHGLGGKGEQAETLNSIRMQMWGGQCLKVYGVRSSCV